MSAQIPKRSRSKSRLHFNIYEGSPARLHRNISLQAVLEPWRSQPMPHFHSVFLLLLLAPVKVLHLPCSATHCRTRSVNFETGRLSISSGQHQMDLGFPAGTIFALSPGRHLGERHMFGLRWIAVFGLCLAGFSLSADSAFAFLAYVSNEKGNSI